MDINSTPGDWSGLLSRVVTPVPLDFMFSRRASLLVLLPLDTSVSLSPKFCLLPSCDVFLIIAAQNCIGKPSFDQKSVLTVNYHTKNQYLAGKGWRVPGMRTPLIALYKMVSHWPINSTTSLEPRTSSMWLGIPCQKWTKKFWTWKLKKKTWKLIKFKLDKIKC